MLKNYLTIAWRQILANKVHTLINLLGLSIGIATLIFILLYLDFQYSHDQNIRYKNRTYRLESKDWEFSTPGPLAPALKQNFPEIETYTRMTFWQLPDFKVDNRNYKINLCIFADREFLKIFKLDFIEGSEPEAFSRPNSILLAQSEAEKIFGRKNALGQTLQISKKVSFTVSGVYKDLPNNLHLKVPALLDFDTADKIMPIKEQMSRRTTYNFPLYLLLSPGVDQQILSRKIDKYCREQFFRDDGNSWYLQNLSQIYFSKISRWPGIEMVMNFGNYKNMRIFALVALLVLLIAVVNFVNLSTAVATLRSKEIGLRKVFGAEKSSIITQFLIESACLCLLSGIIGWLVVWLLLPHFNQQIGTGYSRLILVKPQFLAVFFSILSVTGFVAGLFTALRFACSPLLEIMKRESFRGKSGLLFRRILTGFQFFVSITLIICTLIIYRQLLYMQKTDQGFASGSIVTVTLSRSQLGALPAFRQELTREPLVAATGLSRHEINSPEQHGSDIAMFKADFVDSGYIRALDLKLLAGRNFTPSDAEFTCIVNEKVTKIMRETPQSILGKTAPNLGVVIGVVKDYHFESFHKAIEPIGLIKSEQYQGNLLHIRINGKIADGMNQVNRIYRRIYPEQELNFSVLSSRYAELYQPQRDFLYLFSIFAGLAMLIAGLGIYGLAGYEANRRTKEIGIRKVLGASTTNILLLMLKEIFWLIILSGMIAAPLSYYFMNDWLNGFALKIEIGWLSYAVAVLSALLIAGSCVISVSLRTISVNPVESLKYE